MQARSGIIGALEIFTGRSTNMAGTGAARARTTKKAPSVNVNQKLVEKYLREAIAAFHPKSGEMGQAAKLVTIKNIPTGLTLIWGDQKFLITVQNEDA
jgi:hypothetical protein